MKAELVLQQAREERKGISQHLFNGLVVDLSSLLKFQEREEDGCL